ncbi:MAG: YitT family protein [Chlamydiales bacterium]|nr:YitT family protein [Chlamydiales bacterium]
MQATHHHPKNLATELVYFLWIFIGAALAAFAIQVFLIPNQLIDGGVIGVAMICGKLFGNSLIPLFILIFNLPFLFLAYRYIGKSSLIHMCIAVFLFAIAMVFFENVWPAEFHGESLEVVVIGGALLGFGIGLIIRSGGCLDGTEILGIIINKRTGVTVGQTVLLCNIFIFGAAGVVFQDWHPPMLSLIMYMVAIKVMDTVIVGLDETKSVLIISSKSKEITEAIIHELELGLTIMYGRGGYSGDEREILYVIVERLQLADLKELVHREDPSAFVAVENLHEVANGNQGRPKSGVGKFITPLLQKRHP